MALSDIEAYVCENEQLTERLYLLSLESHEIATAIQPGQFVHLSVPGIESHILRRPFSIYDADPETGRFDILYQVVGVGTDAMTNLAPGDGVKMIAPIGKRWDIPRETKKVLLVGAGVGAAPLYMLAKEAVSLGMEVDVVLGSANRESLVCLDRYSAVLQSEPACSTDDGSYGYRGFCTDVAVSAMDDAQAAGDPYGFVAVCGPEPVMRIVSGAALERDIPCQVSLEKRMACGIGACLSCVVDTPQGKKRVCVDGPIFDAAEVIW